MSLFETEKVTDPNEDVDDFEDLTAEIFNVVDNHLGDLEMVCDESFSFDETMSSFELMDLKMDQRFQRKIVMEQKGHLLDYLDKNSSTLSQGQKLALMRELLVQFATWQDQIGNLEQTIYCNLFLTRKKFYQSSRDLLPFVDAIHYIVHMYQQTSRQTTIFRDEDACYPVTNQPHYVLEPQEIFLKLQVIINEYESIQKSDDKTYEKQVKDYAKCFKLV